MKKIFIFIFIGILFSFTIRDNKSFRYDIKHLTDGDAIDVNLDPKKASILQLSASTKPSMIYNLMPRTRMEFVTVKVTCLIKSAKTDNDGIQLVLCDANDTSLTMIAEVPILGFDSVMTQIHHYVSPDGKIKKGKYQVIGVGFYNIPHAIEGEASNGLGIYPVLGITKL